MIKIDISEKLGAFKPINGIDNGPVCFGSLIDTSYYFKQAAFPYCRLHDTNYPHPREVDIPTIFKDFSANEYNPASYDFRATDIYLKEILDTGAKIIYRLGVSIEHPKLKYFVNPPSNFQKWARVCVNIAKHYNEGWGNGHKWGIEYWEVWNEPDFMGENRAADQMWSGTPEQYFEMYAATSRMFKRELPNVKIGGYAACNFGARFFPDFFKYVKENSLPLDFFSWHTYTNSIETIAQNAKLMRETLDKNGFLKVESILDEWNYTLWDSPWGRGIFDGSERGAKARYESFTESAGEIGAAGTVSAFIAMLDLPIDIATLYDGAPTNIFCTIFDRYGNPTKQYYAFDAFNRLKQTGERVKTECDLRDVYIAAAASKDGDQISVLIANNNANTGHFKYTLEGLEATDDDRYLYELYLLDRYREFEKITEKTCAPSEIPDSAFLYQHSFALIKLTKLEKGE